MGQDCHPDFLTDGGQSAADENHLADGVSDRVQRWDLEDCDGALQHQNRVNVLCVECEDLFTHYRRDGRHRLEGNGR